MFSNLNFCCCKVLFAKLEACRHTGKAWVLQIIPVCRTHYTAWNVRGICLSTEGTSVHCFLFQAVVKYAGAVRQNISCVQRDSGRHC